MNTQLNHHFTYLRFQLKTEDLQNDCRDRLLAKGVTCVEEGHAFEAYGIIDDADLIMQQLADDPDILMVERSDPPAYK